MLARWGGVGSPFTEHRVFGREDEERVRYGVELGVGGRYMEQQADYTPEERDHGMGVFLMVVCPEKVRVMRTEVHHRAFEAWPFAAARSHELFARGMAVSAPSWEYQPTYIADGKCEESTPSTLRQPSYSRHDSTSFESPSRLSLQPPLDQSAMQATVEGAA